MAIESATVSASNQHGQLVPSRVAAVLAASALALAAVFLVAALVLTAQASIGQASGAAGFARMVAIPLGLLLFVVAGAFIAGRRPRNPIGWLFCGIGLTGELQALAVAYLRYVVNGPLASPSDLGPIAWLANVWVVCFGLVLLLFLLFPDGKPLSRRWWPVVWAIPAHTALGLLVVGMEIGTVSTQVPLLRYILGPQLGDQVVQTGRGLHGLSQLALFVAAALSMVRRLRRSRGEERLQLKWIAYASTLLALVFLLTTLLYFSPARAVLDPEAPAAPSLLFGVPFGLALAGVPVAAGLAILQYRLYEIDLLINRTLVYGTLSAIVVGLYVLVVGSLGALLQTDGNVSTTSGQALLVSLLATGLVAVLFQPLRERLQRGVDRLLYGERDDPYGVLSRLSRQLEATLTPEAVLPAVVQTVREALRLPYAAIILKQEHGFVPAADSGLPVPETLRLPLVHQGELIGELELAPRAPGEAFGSADRRLLEDLARLAGVAAHAVRLTLDLQRSREQLVTAREEERRRLRRDLHDGLGSQLAALNIQAGVLRPLIRRDPDAAEEALTELQEELRAAIGNIRRLVHDLRPPALDELGLLSALRERATQYGQDGLSIAVEAPEHLPPLPAAVEVAVYHIVQEALTNAARHAHARFCTVRLSVDGALRLTIADDGVGFRPTSGVGVGLLSMRERAAELGGTCVVRPASRGGTEVSVRLPLPRA